MSILAALAVAAIVFELANVIRHVNRHEWMLDRAVGDTSRIRAALRAAGIAVADPADPPSKPSLWERWTTRRQDDGPEPVTAPMPVTEVVGGARKPSPRPRETYGRHARVDERREDIA